jgi:hypothetical protein
VFRHPPPFFWRVGKTLLAGWRICFKDADSRRRPPARLSVSGKQMDRSTDYINYTFEEVAEWSEWRTGVGSYETFGPRHREELVKSALWMDRIIRITGIRSMRSTGLGEKCE